MAIAQTRSDFEAARRSIDRALARDPTFAAAWAEDAKILFQIVFTDLNRAASEAMMRDAAKAADQAITLDPELPEAYVIRSAIRSDGGAWDLDGARADMERALALSPNDPVTLNAKAHLLLYYSHRLDEAIATLKRVLELDPLDAEAWYWLGYAYRATRRFPDEKAALTRSLEIAPLNSGAQSFLAELELDAGHTQEALAMWNAIKPDEDPFRLYGRVLALEALGRHDESQAELARLVKLDGDENPTFVGCTYARLGDVSRAIDFFEKAFAHHDVAFIDTLASPYLDAVRRDPRWVALLHRMKLIDDPR